MGLALSLVLLVVLAGCGRSTFTETTVTVSGDGTEAVLVGESVSTEAGGETIAIRDGAVFVGDVSYGPVAPGEEVRYAVTPEGRTLSVDGEVRAPAR